MAKKHLADFIHAERVAIVAEWETFARTLLPAAGPLTALALRDHANEILTAIVHDMRMSQSAHERAEKSKGRGGAQRLEKIGQIHASLRIESGFNLNQAVAEYRALRASVLKLWENTGTDFEGVTRFNEAIDEALTEAVIRFTETSTRFRDQSLGILGHDLRNPLSAIIAGATFLISTEQLDDRNAAIAGRLLNSANRMNRMIGDLLDLTRTRSGDPIPVARSRIDLTPICRQVVAELEGLQPDGRVTFATSGDLTGDWDGDRVAQVLSNLLRNAIQHGSSTDPVAVTAEGLDDEVVLAVHNGGKPIPKDAMTTIFDPMVRHTGDDPRNVGLGLGLYIASQIAVAHGGTLEAKSTAAKGTTFTVHLPRRAA